MGYVFRIFWICKPRIGPRDLQNRIGQVLICIPTNFHQNPTNSRRLHDHFTVQIQNFSFFVYIATLFLQNSIYFVRFQAWEPAQTTSQGPNINPKKFQHDLENLIFSFFPTKKFGFFDTYFDIFNIKIKDSELGTCIPTCASKFRFGWSNFRFKTP